MSIDLNTMLLKPNITIFEVRKTLLQTNLNLIDLQGGVVLGEIGIPLDKFLARGFSPRYFLFLCSHVKYLVDYSFKLLDMGCMY